MACVFTEIRRKLDSISLKETPVASYYMVDVTSLSRKIFEITRSSEPVHLYINVNAPDFTKMFILPNALDLRGNAVLCLETKE